MKSISAPLVKSLDGLGQLTDLDSSENLIKPVGREILAAMHNLVVLDLFRNQISSIHSEAFDSLTALKFLYLEVNKLNRIDHRTVQNLRYLAVLHFIQHFVV